jgi:hypothetical protein
MATLTPENFSYDDVKDDFLTLAQTSVFLVDCTSAVSGKPFFASSGMFGNQRKAKLLCCEASIPGSGSATHEATGDFAGVTEKMVYRRIFDDTLDLTFYVDNNYIIPEFLESWHAYCLGETLPGQARADMLAPNAFYRMNYPSEYKGNILLTKFEKDEDRMRVKMSYTFLNAFPQSIASIPISYQQSEILKVTASFSYMRYIKED